MEGDDAKLQSHFISALRLIVIAHLKQESARTRPLQSTVIEMRGHVPSNLIEMGGLPMLGRLEVT